MLAEICYLNKHYICRHIPRIVLEATYGILLPKPEEGQDPDRLPTAHELLGTYGCKWNYFEIRSQRSDRENGLERKQVACHCPSSLRRIMGSFSLN